MENIITERLVIRELNKTDTPMILALLNEPAFKTNIGDKGVTTLDDALNYIQTGPNTMQRELGYSLYCCELRETGEAIGLSGLIKRDGIKLPEIGFAFLTPYCRCGYGYESAYAIIQYATNQLGIERLNAICNPDNIASIGLLKKLGFVYESKVVLPNTTTEINLFEYKSR